MATIVKICTGDCDRALTPEEVDKIIQDASGNEFCPNCKTKILDEKDIDETYAKIEKDIAQEKENKRSRK